MSPQCHKSCTGLLDPKLSWSVVDWILMQKLSQEWTSNVLSQLSLTRTNLKEKHIHTNLLQPGFEPVSHEQRSANWATVPAQFCFSGRFSPKRIPEDDSLTFHIVLKFGVKIDLHNQASDGIRKSRKNNLFLFHRFARVHIFEAGNWTCDHKIEIR